MAWTAEKIATLTRMADWHAASEIAEILGVTRNAVIGKLRRLGVPLRDARTKPSPISAVPTGNLTGKHQRPRSAKMKAPTPPKPLPTVIAEPVCSHVDIAGLRPRSCRWPVAEDARGVVRLYCGEVAPAGSPWCSKHLLIAWTTPEQRRRA